VLFDVVLDNKRVRTSRGADEGNTRIGVRDSRLEWLDSTVAAMLITARNRGDTCACEGTEVGGEERGTGTRRRDVLWWWSLARLVSGINR
jgi:hypothetical protein